MASTRSTRSSVSAISQGYLGRFVEAGIAKKADAMKMDASSLARQITLEYIRAYGKDMPFVEVYYAILPIVTAHQESKSSKSKDTSKLTALAEAAAASDLQDELEDLVYDEWNNYDSSKMEMSSWVRKVTAKWMHDHKGKSFASMYNLIMKMATELEEDEDDESEYNAGEVAEDEEEDDAEDEEEEDYVEEDEEDDVEKRANSSVLHRHFTKWWDAFRKEAEEDTDPDSMDAYERFVADATKLLRVRTYGQIADNTLAKIIDDWLLANEDNLDW